jgi:hypothetical protein
MSRATYTPGDHNAFPAAKFRSDTRAAAPTSAAEMRDPNMDRAGLRRHREALVATRQSTWRERSCPSFPARNRPKIDAKRAGVLLRYGGWVTLTGLVGPLLKVVDRVVIGSVLGATAVTRYTVPFALVSRVQVLSRSLARTIFPRFDARA